MGFGIGGRGPCADGTRRGGRPLNGLGCVVEFGVGEGEWMGEGEGFNGRAEREDDRVGRAVRDGTTGYAGGCAMLDSLSGYCMQNPFTEPRGSLKAGNTGWRG